MARWFWKNGRVAGNLIVWDLESVNTCPENYQSHETLISVEAAGLYELTLGFFAKMKGASLKIMVNEECVSVKQMEESDCILKKVCAIEFVVLPARARLTVAYDLKGEQSKGTIQAEGFLGLRKL